MLSVTVLMHECCFDQKLFLTSPMIHMSEIEHRLLSESAAPFIAKVSQLREVINAYRKLI